MASPVNDKTERSIKSVAVVGAGVSGLAAAYKLKSHGLEVTLFEAEGRTGGKIRSMSQNGFVWDEGANTMTETEFEVGRLINNLGLREKQQSPISQNKRYIVKNGRPELIPPNPIALIKGNFLSLQSKFRIIFEPFLWRSSGIRSGPSKISPEYSQESVGEFFCRHFGKEVVDYLIDPFVAGTSGGDPESLSMRHAFPEIWQLEKNFGSIILGSIRSKFSQNKVSETCTSLEKRDKKILHGSFSFVGGMQTLTDALSKEIGLDNIQLNSKVRSLSYNHDEDPLSRDWFVSYDTNTATNNGSTLERSFDAVVMTAPLSNVKEMKITRNGNPFILDFLPVVNYLPLSILVTAFRKEDVKRPLEGFGVLVPSKEQENGLKTLGTLFSSMMFPDRAAGDCYLYTTFIGGSRNRDLASASLDQLKAIVTSDLRKLLGVEGQPTFLKHIYWSDAFPLYSRDYDLVLKAIERLENGFPGLFYAGNHRDGLSVGKAISSGCKAADLVVSYLK